MAWLWFVLGALLAVAEVFTGTFDLVMLAVGAFAAGGAGALGAPLPVQGLVFAIVSVLALLVVRPAVRRHWRNVTPDRLVGMEALEGSSGLVLERVDADQGLIKLGGETWLARAYDTTQVFEPGEHVRIIEIKGATALVWRD
jgi:membrane protein implicated in regulation of membrane protease activity